MAAQRGIRVAFVGSAEYPALATVESKVRGFQPGTWPGCSVLVVGSPDFSSFVLTLAAEIGLPAKTPPLNPVQRLIARSSVREQAQVAVQGCDLLLAFWDGASQDATQAAASFALKTGAVFTVFGPTGKPVRAGNQGEEVEVPDHWDDS